MQMFLLVAISLAVYRVNRLIIHDTIFDRPRSAFINWLLPKRGGGTVVELITCPFCIGMWVSGVATIVTSQVAAVPLPVLVWLASAAGSMIAWRIIEDE